jgi:hypothetical protein
MLEELELLQEPDSFEAMLASDKYVPLVEKYGQKKASIILAKAFTEKLQEEYRSINKEHIAEAIENTKKQFTAIMARRYMLLFEENKIGC